MRDDKIAKTGRVYKGILTSPRAYAIDRARKYLKFNFDELLLNFDDRLSTTKTRQFDTFHLNLKNEKPETEFDILSALYVYDGVVNT